MSEENKPAADNQDGECARGVWVYTTVTGGLRYWYCSVCESAYHRKDPRHRKYCYHCGARMKMDGDRSW